MLQNTSTTQAAGPFFTSRKYYSATQHHTNTQHAHTRDTIFRTIFLLSTVGITNRRAPVVKRQDNQTPPTLQVCIVALTSTTSRTQTNAPNKIRHRPRYVSRKGHYTCNLSRSKHRRFWRYLTTTKFWDEYTTKRRQSTSEQGYAGTEAVNKPEHIPKYCTTYTEYSNDQLRMQEQKMKVSLPAAFRLDNDLDCRVYPFSKSKSQNRNSLKYNRIISAT